MNDPPRPARKTSSKPDPGGDELALARLNLAIGWWSLFGFLLFGIVLDAFHGLKVRWYLDVENSTRRLLWTLAHAHGTLLGFIHIAYALTLKTFPPRDLAGARRATPWLLAATALLPGGFFLGGVTFYSGDPGLGALLVPPGGVALAVGVLLATRAILDSGGRRGD